MALRLQSEIGGRRVPLWFEVQGGGICVWSLCQGVSTAAPVFIIGDDEQEAVRMQRLLRSAGYEKVTIEVKP